LRQYRVSILDLWLLFTSIIAKVCRKVFLSHKFGLVSINHMF